MSFNGGHHTVYSNDDAQQTLLIYNQNPIESGLKKSKTYRIISFSVNFANWKLRAVLVLIICVYFLYVCMTAETLRKLNNTSHMRYSTSKKFYKPLGIFAPTIFNRLKYFSMFWFLLFYNRRKCNGYKDKHGCCDNEK